MGNDREDSPDWLRSFQAPSLTTLSSDSEASGEKSVSSADSFDDDEKISVLRSSSKATTKRRLEVDDETPVKRRKTDKGKKGGEKRNKVLQDEPVRISYARSKDDDNIKSEESPDQPANTSERNHSVWALSSDSESDSKAAVKDEVKEESSIQDLSDLMETEEKSDRAGAAPKTAIKKKSPKKKKLENVKPTGKKKTSKPLKMEDAPLKEEEANDDSRTHELSESVKEEEENDIEEAASKVTVTGKTPRKRAQVENVNNKIKRTEPLELEGEVGDMEVAKEGISEKHIESRVSTSRLALVLPDKVSRTKALVECEGETIDLSGDVGAVGRVVIPDTPGDPEVLLDLKGTIYKTTIVPSRTFCVVSIGQSEAKIEAIMNDFIQLKPQSNVYDAETMVEGTLEGFSFDSEDEADKMPKDVKGDQDEGAEEQTTKKPKGKAEKKSGTTQKKGKAAMGKQPKKRKPQVTKKGKGKK